MGFFEEIQYSRALRPQATLPHGLSPHFSENKSSYYQYILEIENNFAEDGKG